MHHRSLPGSRRSSFQSAQEQPEAEVPAAPPPPSYNRDRRRSSCARMLRDPEEILKSLKAVKGELGRTMSLSGDKRHRSEYCEKIRVNEWYFISFLYTYCYVHCARYHTELHRNKNFYQIVASANIILPDKLYFICVWAYDYLLFGYDWGQRINTEVLYYYGCLNWNMSYKNIQGCYIFDTAVILYSGHVLRQRSGVFTLILQFIKKVNVIRLQRLRRVERSVRCQLSKNYYVFPWVCGKLKISQIILKYCRYFYESRVFR